MFKARRKTSDSPTRTSPFDALVAASAAALEVANGTDEISSADGLLRKAANDFAGANARNMDIDEFDESDRRSAAESMVQLLRGRLNGGDTPRPPQNHMLVYCLKSKFVFRYKRCRSPVALP